MKCVCEDRVLVRKVIVRLATSKLTVRDAIVSANYCPSDPRSKDVLLFCKKSRY